MEALIKLLDNIIFIDPVKIAVKVFSRTDVKNFIIELNTKNQLFDKGIDSENLLLPLYKRNYSSKKRVGTPYDLKDTGAFYNSFRVEITSNATIIIHANTNKPNKNLLDYSPDIIGLTDESKKLLIQKVKPIFQEVIKKEIMLL